MKTVLQWIYKSPHCGFFILQKSNKLWYCWTKTKTKIQMNILKNKIAILVFAATTVSVIGLLFFITPIKSDSLSILDIAIDSQSLTSLTNQIREVKQLNPLITNDKLLRAANAKADYLIKNNYFSHNSPTGKQFSEWIEEAGYKYQIIGENLAVGYDTNKDVMKAWMDSSSHRNNILNKKYREIGIVVKHNKIGENKQILIVQIFGSPRILKLSELFSGFNNTPLPESPLYA